MTPQNMATPRPEHPRPDFQREPWLNLNGRWRFSFDPRDVGEQMRWYRVSASPSATLGDTATTIQPVPIEDPFLSEIVVPFPWESKLSGVGDTQYKGAAWYQRSLDIPTDWAITDAPAGPRDATGLPSAEDTAQASTAIGAAVDWRLRPYLCFGAIDWNAKVWVNGRFVGEHDGGYTPFSLDISRYVRPGQTATLTVRAWDSCAADTPIGKQTERWYTHSGGIWQTVWLEGRAAAVLTSLHIIPNLDAGTATFSLAIEAAADVQPGPFHVTITSRDGLFPTVEHEVVVQPGRTEMAAEIHVPNPRPWSPEDPFLYDCRVRLAPAGTSVGGADDVATYFGMRSITRGRWEDRPYEFLFLNGEPVYLRGALDQALHPEGLHAYPTDDAIRADVQLAKDLGLNMLRCHIKVNEPRYYYWADKLGVLVMYDLPSAAVYTQRARQNWEQTFRDALDRDLSHPSIIAWILFNETWGLEEHQTPASWSWVRAMFDLAKQLDPSRIIEDNSACLYDHVVTDINTWHFYIDDYDRARRHVERVVEQTYAGSRFNYVAGRYSGVQESGVHVQGTEPLLNSEYAGLSASQGDRDISYTFKYLTTELRRHDKICGYVYTELADIEWEHNGLVNYDRTWKEYGYDTFVPGMTVADMNAADFVGLHCPPCQTLRPGTTFMAEAFVSHWDKRPLRGARLCWSVVVVDRFGETRIVTCGELPVEPRRYGVTMAGQVSFSLPDEACLLTVRLTLEDETQAIRARNYVNIDVFDPNRLHLVSGEEKTSNGYTLRFTPGDFVDSNWAEPRVGPHGAKFGATGAGWVEYSLPIPTDVAVERITGLTLRFEAGARTARQRIGWKAPLHIYTTDYPQTEEQKLPTDLVVSMNGIEVGATRLPDDPADARGILSAHLSSHWENASYGFLQTFKVDGETTRRVLEAGSDGAVTIRFEVPSSGVRGGLSLYGARMGAHPVDPMLFLEVAE